MRPLDLQRSSCRWAEDKPKSWKSGLLLPVLSIMALSGSGCDPGFTYSPVDARGSKVERWSQRVDDVTFEAEQYDKLGFADDDVTVLNQNFTIANNSDVDVVVLRARIETNGTSIDATQVGAPQFPEWRRKVAKRTREGVTALWDFTRVDSPWPRGLGQSYTVMWTVQIGTVEHLLKVRMELDNR